MSMEVRIEKRLGARFRLAADFHTGGDALGILGPSGCGKSMTLKCIAGVETPDRGRIVLNGRVLFDSEAGINLKPQQRRVGYLFQNYALFPRMTVAANIGASCAAKRGDAGEWIRRLGLDGLEKRYPHQLSGGQQQRVALARMLAANPEAILLDEPFSALDTHLRERMQVLLKDVVRQYPDAVMVTHSRDEAYRLCGELLVLADGKVLGHGKTGDLFRKPGTLQIAGLTGCKNFSRIERLGKFRIRALDWELDLDTAVPVADDIRHVGIRAHDLRPLPSRASAPDNVVEMRICDRVEDPFEWNVLFTNALATGIGAENRMWWKYSKYSEPDSPRFLRLPPEALLLLTEP